MANISDKTLGKLVSLAILAVGLAIGFICGEMYHPQQEVRAQAVAASTPTIQEIQPGMTTGTFGANLVMAHEIAADSLVVNGYDLLKMQNNILVYLSNRPSAERADIQNIVNASRASTIYRIKQQAPMPTPPVANPPANEKK
jgi:hypothetical protein